MPVFAGICLSCWALRWCGSLFLQTRVNKLTHATPPHATRPCDSFFVFLAGCGAILSCTPLLLSFAAETVALPANACKVFGPRCLLFAGACIGSVSEACSALRGFGSFPWLVSLKRRVKAVVSGERGTLDSERPCLPIQLIQVVKTWYSALRSRPAFLGIPGEEPGPPSFAASLFPSRR